MQLFSFILMTFLYLFASPIFVCASQEDEEIESDTQTIIHPFAYSKAIPQFEKAYSFDYIPSDRWSQNSKIGRLYEVSSKMKELFEEKDFINLKGNFHVGDCVISDVYVKFVSGKLTDCIAFEMYYPSKGIKPFFESYRSLSFDPVDINKKWHIRAAREKNVRSIKSGSWDCVDFFIHSMTRNKKTFKDFKADLMEGILWERLYKRIRRKGLENSFNRIALVVNDNAKFHFYNFYSNQDEKSKNQKLLQSLSLGR